MSGALIRVRDVNVVCDVLVVNDGHAVCDVHVVLAVHVVLNVHNGHDVLNESPPIRYTSAAIAPRFGVFAATPKCLALVAASLDVAFHHRSTAFGAGRGTLVNALLLLGLQSFLGHVFGKTSAQKQQNADYSAVAIYMNRKTIVERPQRYSRKPPQIGQKKSFA